MIQTSNRVAMISGANRGIGAAITARLAAAGWDLSLGMRRPTRSTAAPDALVHAYDAEIAAAEVGWVEETLTRFGRVDAIVCNAGVMIPKSAIAITETEMASMFTVNVFGPQRLARAAWSALSASGRGRIVVLCSLSGKRVSSADSGAYAMTKFAALGMTHALRHAGWHAGIRATAICPGFVATDMAAALTDMDPATMTQPEDVATLVETALNLPNNASMPEIAVNGLIEGNF
jgi:NAD(P)-dependent dehydrogenase (short-subunit alcohol dehydrogenase family)